MLFPFDSFVSVCLRLSFVGDRQCWYTFPHLSRLAEPYLAISRWFRPGRVSAIGDWPLYCPNCGHPWSDAPNYCSQCGQALAPPHPPAPSDKGQSPTGPVRVPWGSGQVGPGILVMVLSVFPILILAVNLGNLAGDNADALVTWTTSHLLGLVVFAVVWHFGLNRYHAPVSSLGLTRPRLPRIKLVLLTIGALLASLASNLIYATLMDLLGLDFLSPPEIDEGIAFSGPAAAFTFQALAVWTPLTEEIFFRGFVFAGLSPRWGVGRAMVASALIFSIFHLSMGLLAPIFITGLLLAWLYRRTGSLWPSIAAHAGQNALAVVAVLYGG